MTAPGCQRQPAQRSFRLKSKAGAGGLSRAAKTWNLSDGGVSFTYRIFAVACALASLSDHAAPSLIRSPSGPYATQNQIDCLPFLGCHDQ